MKIIIDNIEVKKFIEAPNNIMTINDDEYFEILYQAKKIVQDNIEMQNHIAY